MKTRRDQATTGLGRHVRRLRRLDLRNDSESRPEPRGAWQECGDQRSRRYGVGCNPLIIRRVIVSSSRRESAPQRVEGLRVTATRGRGDLDLSTEGRVRTGKTMYSDAAFAVETCRATRAGLPTCRPRGASRNRTSFSRSSDERSITRLAHAPYTFKSGGDENREDVFRVLPLHHPGSSGRSPWFQGPESNRIFDLERV